MVRCKTLDEALAVKGVAHIESGAGGVIAYQAGDTLPGHCRHPDMSAEGPTLEERDAQDESAEEAAVEAAAVEDPSLWSKVLTWITK